MEMAFSQFFAQKFAGNRGFNAFYLFPRQWIDEFRLFLKTPAGKVIVFGIFLRVVIYSVVFVFPLPFGKGAPISPKHYQTGGDLPFYLDFIPVITGENGARNHFFEVYQRLLQFEPVRDRFPGPVYPTLLYVFDYRVGHTILFSVVIFLTELITYVCWQKWLIQKLGVPFAIPFCFLLQPLWFAVYLSSDVFFYLICTLFYLKITEAKTWYEQPSVWLLIFLAIATRPGGVAIVVVALYAFLKKPIAFSKFKDSLKLAYLIGLLLISTIYYLPYGLIDRTIVNGIDKFDYLSQQVPLYIHLVPFDKDSMVGILLRIVAKFFWLFGFHPSNSHMVSALLYRIITGSFFLFGFASVLLKRDLSTFYVVLFVVPTVLFLYPGWRYLLPILPLLYQETASRIKLHFDQ